MPRCAWEGCDRPGPHRAPKGRRAQGQYFSFCLEHVRAYNQNFDFFEGLDDSQIGAHTASLASAGGRPTWKTGTNRAARPGLHPGPGQQPRSATGPKRLSDPLNLFARLARNRGHDPAAAPQQRLVEADKRAFEMLGLSGRPDRITIKSAYKNLVKIHHPDANGGDRASEDRLRAIISAYNHLKSKGFA